MAARPRSRSVSSTLVIRQACSPGGGSRVVAGLVATGEWLSRLLRSLSTVLEGLPLLIIATDLCDVGLATSVERHTRLAGRTAGSAEHTED